MDHFGIIISLFGVLLLAMFGVWGWTWKVSRDTSLQLGEMYKVMNTHLQNAAIHEDRKGLVSADVCKVVHENIDKKMDEIGKDVKCLLAKA